MVAPPSISLYIIRRISRGSLAINVDCDWSKVFWSSLFSTNGIVSGRKRGSGVLGLGELYGLRLTTEHSLLGLMKQIAHKTQGPQHTQKRLLQANDPAFPSNFPACFPALLYGEGLVIVNSAVLSIDRGSCEVRSCGVGLRLSTRPIRKQHYPSEGKPRTCAESGNARVIDDPGARITVNSLWSTPNVPPPRSQSSWSCTTRPPVRMSEAGREP